MGIRRNVGVFYFVLVVVVCVLNLYLYVEILSSLLDAALIRKIHLIYALTKFLVLLSINGALFLLTVMLDYVKQGEGSKKTTG